MHIRRLIIVYYLIFFGALVNGQTNIVIIPILKAERTKDDIALYTNQITTLVNSPNLLNTIPLDDLILIERHLCAAYIKSAPGISNWSELRSSETKLIGYVLMSLKSRIDPTIDTKRPMPMSYLSYAFVAKPEDKDNQLKEKAYNEWVETQSKLDKIEENQLSIQQDITICIRAGSLYLPHLYPDPNSKPIEQKLLKSTGLDDNTVNLLMSK